jgi:hypothetical protein
MTSSKSITAPIALFRKLALSLEGAIESSHMNHPDFRFNNRIFATLSAQEKGFGVLKLTLEQQQAFLADHPKSSLPSREAGGAWA